jgi:hypothetical protein
MPPIGPPRRAPLAPAAPARPPMYDPNDRPPPVNPMDLPQEQQDAMSAEDWNRYAQDWVNYAQANARPNPVQQRQAELGIENRDEAIDLMPDDYYDKFPEHYQRVQSINPRQYERLTTITHDLLRESRNDHNLFSNGEGHNFIKTPFGPIRLPNRQSSPQEPELFRQFGAMLDIYQRVPSEGLKAQAKEFYSRLPRQHRGIYLHDDLRVQHHLENLQRRQTNYENALLGIQTRYKTFTSPNGKRALQDNFDPYEKYFREDIPQRLKRRSPQLQNAYDRFRNTHLALMGGQLIAPPLPFHQHLALIGAQDRQNTGYATLNHPGFAALDDD